MNSQSVRVDLLIMPDGTAYLTSSQRPDKRQRVPPDDGSDESSLPFVMARFHAECETGEPA
jgi:hypothetical protein